MSRIRDFISCSSFKYKFFLFLNRKNVRNSKQINIVFEYRILFFNNERRQNLLQNHHVDFQFEQFSFLNRRLKDLALKIKIWEYINSYNQIAESREEILFEISHYAVKAFAFASLTAVDDFIINQINQSAQDFTQSRFAKYFHELSTQQQENYRASVKEYKQKKKQIVKII
jgi:hypothetical protein